MMVDKTLQIDIELTKRSDTDLLQLNVLTLVMK